MPALRAWRRVLDCTLARARLRCLVEHASVTLEILACLPRLRADALLHDGVGFLMFFFAADFGRLVFVCMVASCPRGVGRGGRCGLLVVDLAVLSEELVGCFYCLL